MLLSGDLLTHFPENTSTHFKTKLHSAVDLKGEWESSVVEMFYPQTYCTIEDGELSLTRIEHNTQTTTVDGITMQITKSLLVMCFVLPLH